MRLHTKSTYAREEAQMVSKKVRVRTRSKSGTFEIFEIMAHVLIGRT